MKHLLTVVLVVANLFLGVGLYNDFNEPEVTHLQVEQVHALEAQEITEPVMPQPEIAEVEETPSTPVEPEVMAVTWQDNPNNCTSEQWIAKDTFKCIDKPKVEQKPAVTAQPLSNPVGCEHYRAELAKYSWDVQTMMYAMQKESSCNPNAVGDNYAINGLHAVSCGLLQVRTLAGRPSCQELKDPVTNIAWSYKIWQSQGYRAWSTLK